MKNPFESQKKTVVRRDAKDVYKGLNKLDHIGTTPIDVLFHKLEGQLDGRLNELTLEVLLSRFEVADRYTLIEAFLNHLIEIQRYSEAFVDAEKKDLVKISLHDIKTFSKLVNCIIIFGIYPILSRYNIGIPIEKRNLKDFATKQQLAVKKDPKSSTENDHLLLKLIYTKFLYVFSVESDVKDLLIKGTGYSDFLIITIALITQFNDKDVDYEKVISIPETFELYQTLTLLLASPSVTPPQLHFKQFVMHQLKMLPARAPKKDGLLNLIEYVLGMRENEEINVEKFDHISNIVLLKPKEIPPNEYFDSIGLQCYDLLVNINKPVIISCVGHIIEVLWMKNQRIVIDFLLTRTWQNMDPKTTGADSLVTERNLNNNINVLISLSQKSFSPDLMKALIEPILLPIWSYYVFMQNNQKPFLMISNILTSFFTIMGAEAIDALDLLTKNLLWESDTWEFQFGPNKLVQIVEKTITITENNKMQKVLEHLERNGDYFLSLLGELEDDLIQKLFVKLLQRWLEKSDLDSIEELNPIFTLVDLQILEKIGSKFNDVLARTPMEILEILDKFLEVPIVDEGADGADSDDEDEEDLFLESFPNVLELLSAILSESALELNEACVNLLKSIQSKLRAISKTNTPQVSKNSSQALHDRIELLLNVDQKHAVSQKDIDTNTLKRAITSLNDPLVPIRAHGLHLLRTLIEKKSEVISLDFVINLHLVQLKDSEPFIYLSVIKGIELLIEWNEFDMLKLLLDIYVDGEADIDERLRIGEVLLRYIQHSSKHFSGKTAKLLVESMLSIIRRSDTSNVDVRLRMSSMSLLGTCCKTNPIGFVSNLTDVLDCAIGILQLEMDKDSAVMRRSAIVLIHDLILGTSDSATLEFPNLYRATVYNLLVYVSETDNDVLVREQSVIVLDTIQELAKLAVEMSLEDRR